MNDNRFILILGGARSGKSSYALRLAEATRQSVTFIATAQAFDDEMAARIKKHQSERPAHWQTLEIPFDIASHAEEIKSEIVILDCITLLISNVLMQFVKGGRAEEAPFMKEAQRQIDALLSAIRKSDQRWLIVSNEVGLGLVPPYQIGRVYRDALGWANQRLAQEAEKVLFMAAGIPIPIKG